MSSDRVPPNSLESERAVLSACLLDRGAVDVAGGTGLKPEEFYAEPNRRIYEAILFLAEQGSPIDIVTVAARLRDTERLNQVGGATYLAEIVDCAPAVAHVEAYALEVRGKATKRAVIATCQRLAAEGYSDQSPGNEFADRAEQAIYDIQRPGVGVGLEHVGISTPRVFKAITDRAARGERISGIPTGFERLDAKMAGLQDGELTVVGARPGMGKTSLVMNIAVNVAASRIDPEASQSDPDPATIPGVGVAVFSLEMERDALVSRICCSEGRVDLGKMRQGFLQDRDWDNLTTAAGKMVTLPIWIDDTPAIGVLELRAKARRLDADIRRTGTVNGLPVKRLGLIVIDYLQLMSPSPTGNSHRSRQQEVGEITRALKRLAKELKIPVVALAQLNRAVETKGLKNKRPGLADLREAGDIEQDADNVIFIYRDDYYEADSQERGVAELLIGKQRNGPTGLVKVRFEAAYVRFDNLAPGEWNEDEAA